MHEPPPRRPGQPRDSNTVWWTSGTRRGVIAVHVALGCAWSVVVVHTVLDTRSWLVTLLYALVVQPGVLAAGVVAVIGLVTARRRPDVNLAGLLLCADVFAFLGMETLRRM